MKKHDDTHTPKSRTPTEKLRKHKVKKAPSEPHEETLTPEEFAAHEKRQQPKKAPPTTSTVTASEVLTAAAPELFRPVAPIVAASLWSKMNWIDKTKWWIANCLFPWAARDMRKWSLEVHRHTVVHTRSQFPDLPTWAEQKPFAPVLEQIAAVPEKKLRLIDQITKLP